jgi:hypothetical protein
MIQKNLDNIFNCKKLTLAEFGNGDIAVGGFVANTPDGEKIAMLTLQNISESREIGSTDITMDQEVKKMQFDILMTFPKKESIDVVLGALQQLKENL